MGKYLILFLVCWVVCSIIYYFIDARERKAKKLLPQSPAKPVASTTERVTEIKPGEYQYNIKGLNLRGLDDSILGDFYGTARSLKSNPHDPHAIGVYVGSRRVGFLPRGNDELWQTIMDRGGIVDAIGYIAKAEDEQTGRPFYYGKVSLYI